MTQISKKICLSLLTLCLVFGCAPTGIYHTVKPGQTLYRIAMTYDVDEAHLAQINNISDPTQLKVNQKIFIPDATSRRNVPATVVKPSPVTSSGTAAQKRPETVARQPETGKKPAAKSTGSAKPVKGIFAWPVQGKVINEFGTRGQKVYKGIEIGVPRGTRVTAAASGKVIYSGNAIPGYGNLVILEHSDSYFSVYGYNQKNLVKMDDFVGQGDEIALSGVPPSGQSARLHFEIRKGKSAVNPILYLP
jgi:lipoprotein NlpD